MKPIELRIAIVSAVASGWCAPENSHKEMDEALAQAIINNVIRLFQDHTSLLNEWLPA